MHSKQNTYQTFDDKSPHAAKHLMLPTEETEVPSEIEFVQSDLNGLNERQMERQKSASHIIETYNKHSKSNKMLLIVLSVIIVILIIICIVLGVNAYSWRSDVMKKDSAIPLHLIEGLDSYLAQHCVLHRDVFEGEGMDVNGEGFTVIRNPIEISLPININYSPLLNNITGEIEYFSVLDANGNLVAKPLCQTDFNTSSYTMKNNGYSFDRYPGCEYPLPLWLNETDILNLPRRYTPITHRITITTVEVVAELEQGHTFKFMTYNATVPGPPIRVRVGDWIDLTLINPNTSLHEHSIDFHAMNGPGGGAESLRVLPGEFARTIWQATVPGMFIYHCASGWVSDHISKGMYGAIIVEPEFGLPYSDMDVYLGFGELYLRYPLVNNMGTNFERPPPNLHNEFDPIKERYEMSDVVMMNGAPFSLLHNPIITTVGSIVRAFVVAGGPNLINSFHIIGDSFDRVWLHGDLSTTPQQNVQTTTVPPGGCAIADWRHDTPGTFIFVDHALTRAFVRGNIGIIRACDANDDGCLSGETAGSYNRKYTCAPDRYNNEDTLIDNDDCLFCPWIRDEFTYLHQLYDETDEIYAYLDEQCNILDLNISWQGNDSRHNDTVNDIDNYWRKKRYPGSMQWSLSERLRVADPMIGNQRGGPSSGGGDDDDDDFDDSTCIVSVGNEIQNGITIEYSMQKNGQGSIIISSEYESVSNTGGWISFGRGGDTISTMTDSHVHTVIFNSDLSQIEFEAHWLRGYSTPMLDDSSDIFPISNPSISINDEIISFSFNILSGHWIEPPSPDLTSVPMVVAIGRIVNIPQKENMIKHYNKDIIYLNLIAEQCILGGTIVS